MTHQKITYIALITLILVVIWQVYATQPKDNSDKTSRETSSAQTYSPSTQSKPKVNLVGAYSKPLTIGNTKLDVEIASTTEAQTQGLSGREPLTETQGMLFDLRNSPSGIPTFWMRDMRFDLDIIWINNFTVIDISKNVPKPNPLAALNQLPRYSPTQNADMVLEIMSGWSDKNKIKVGDKIVLPN